MASELPTQRFVTDNEYVWRQIGEHRWLCVQQDSNHILGGITKEGIRRYRIQLASHGGILLSDVIILENFQLARRMLKAKLRIRRR